MLYAREGKRRFSVVLATRHRDTDFVVDHVPTASNVYDRKMSNHAHGPMHNALYFAPKADWAVGSRAFGRWAGWSAGQMGRHVKC